LPIGLKRVASTLSSRRSGRYRLPRRKLSYPRLLPVLAKALCPMRSSPRIDMSSTTWVRRGPTLRRDASRSWGSRQLLETRLAPQSAFSQCRQIDSGLVSSILPGWRPRHQLACQTRIVESFTKGAGVHSPLNQKAAARRHGFSIPADRLFWPTICRTTRALTLTTVVP
jgi:hypothetical protein